MLRNVKKIQKIMILGLGIALLPMVLALGTAICLPGSASATIVSVAEDIVANAVSVNIYAVGIGNVGTEAGNYMVKYSTAPTTLVSGFCIDPHYSNKAFSPYEVQSITEGSGFEAAAWVLSRGYSPALAAAAQVAVWELTWDSQYGRGFDLANGDFRLNSPLTTSFVTDVTNIYNAALTGRGAGFDQAPYAMLHSPANSGGTDYQDYIVANPFYTPPTGGSPAPIPASFVLLASGLLGLGLLGYKKKAVPVRREKN